MTFFEHDAQFAAGLEECCRRVRRGASLQDCLASYPAEYHEELARLAALAAQLSRVARDPSPEFQTRLQETLLTSLEAERRQQRPWLSRLCGRFSLARPAVRVAVIALVALVILAGGSLGVVQATEGSLPDSPLYQVTAAREWAELALARNSKTEVRVRVNHATRRAREMERAEKAGKARVMETLASRLSSTLERTVDKALEERANGNGKPARRALAAIRAMENKLERLETDAPPTVLPSLQQLRSFLNQQERRLSEP